MVVPLSALMNLMMYGVINAFTPGPGNILALNTVTNYGWKRGRRLFLGIFSGYYAVQLLCAVFVFGVGAFLPRALELMRYVGAAYILWLAYHIATGRPEFSETGGSASFAKGFLLQLVNVKIYLFGITALTAYIAPYSRELRVLVICELLIATMGMAATLTWIGAGMLLRRFYLRYYRPVNVVMALLLLECIWGILR